MKAPAVQCFSKAAESQICPRGLLEIDRDLFAVILSDAALSQYRLVRL